MARALKRGEAGSRRWQAFWLAMATLVCAGMAPLGAVGAIFGWLVFDAPGNLLNPIAWVTFLLMIFFWAACILAPFAAWVFWSRGQERRAWTAIAAPLVWLAVTAALMQFVPH